MRVLALDVGKVRVGIAVSDARLRVATPVCVLKTAKVENMDVSFRRVLQEWEPKLLLYGLPYTLAGERDVQAKKIQNFAERLSEKCTLPYEFVDERLSSKEATRILREEGLSEKKMRDKVDMIAASLFLQAWLDEQQHKADGQQRKTES